MIAPQCIRDTLGACHQQVAPKSIVFVPVDGRQVFLVCVLLIAACVAWMIMWVSKGVRFEEKS